MTSKEKYDILLTMKNKTNILGIRLDPDSRAEFDRMAEELNISASALVRYMMRFCTRLNLEGTGYEMKSDFRQFVEYRMSRPLFS